jgi:hypothetical protein
MGELTGAEVKLSERNEGPGVVCGGFHRFARGPVRARTGPTV